MCPHRHLPAMFVAASFMTDKPRKRASRPLAGDAYREGFVRTAANGYPALQEASRPAAKRRGEREASLAVWRKPLNTLQAESHRAASGKSTLRRR